MRGLLVVENHIVSDQLWITGVIAVIVFPPFA